MSMRTMVSSDGGPATPRPAMRSQHSLAHMNNFLSGGLHPTCGLAHSVTKGGRVVNEDAFLLESRQIASGARITLMGVFDGHGNEQLSYWLSSHFGDVFFKVFSILQQSYGLPRCIEYTRKLFPSDESFRVRSARISLLNCPDVVTLTLCTSLAICEEQAMSLTHVDTAQGGSVATVIAVTAGGFFVAKVGDASAALVATRPVNLVLKTSEHRTVCRPDEVSRVTASGGSVYKGNAVGMAFSSLNVTRSLGDLIWRANDDWRRDNTRDRSSNQKAIDESLTAFSKQRGCVGLTSEPEWYSCCCHGGSTGGEDVVHWAVSTNSPTEYASIATSRLFKGSELEFFLIAGSDGFWETQAMPHILRGLDSHAMSAPDILKSALASIGDTPHDDSTVVVLQMRVDPSDLVLAPPGTASQRRKTVASSIADSSEGELTQSAPRKTVTKRRTLSNDGQGHLDYLFS